MTKGLCWRALEANPEIIFNYAKTLGGPSNIHFCDVLSTEEWALEMTPQPIYALLLVYPITEASEKFSKTLQQHNRKQCEMDKEKEEIVQRIWFTKQTVGNACGTVALLHIFANLQDKCSLQPGGYLEQYYAKSYNLTADERATALEVDDCIMRAHTNAETEGQSYHREEVTEHFVAFVEYGGYVIELDGRKTRPIIHGEKIDNKTSFLQRTSAVIKRNYIDVDPEEVRFSIIAVTGNPP